MCRVSVQRGRQLEQSERVACGIVEHKGTDLRREFRSVCVEQRRRRYGVKAVQVELGDSCSIDVVVEPVPDPERNDDWLGFNSRIEPLGLICDDQNWRPGGCFCEELQHREADHERVGGHRFGQSKRSTERGPLRRFQLRQSTEDRAKQMVESGKWQMRF